MEYLTDKNILLLETPLQKNNFGQGLDLRQLLRQLGERGIDSILLEGGGTLNGSALQENLVQRVYAFVAPKLIAGADAKSPVEGIGIPRMKDAVELQDIEIIPAGRDICITGRIEKEGKCLPES